ncbi:MAG: hypothetical protein NVSMB1_20640 [Polyangiales bacterium]
MFKPLIAVTASLCAWVIGCGGAGAPMDEPGGSNTEATNASVTSFDGRWEWASGSIAIDSTLGTCAWNGRPSSCKLFANEAPRQFVKEDGSLFTVRGNFLLTSEAAQTPGLMKVTLYRPNVSVDSNRLTLQPMYVGAAFLSTRVELASFKVPPQRTEIEAFRMGALAQAKKLSGAWSALARKPDPKEPETSQVASFTIVTGDDDSKGFQCSAKGSQFPDGSCTFLNDVAFAKLPIQWGSRAVPSGTGQFLRFTSADRNDVIAQYWFKDENTLRLKEIARGTTTTLQAVPDVIGFYSRIAH